VGGLFKSPRQYPWNVKSDCITVQNKEDHTSQIYEQSGKWLISLQIEASLKGTEKQKNYATKSFADDITLCCGSYFYSWGKIEVSCSLLSRE
jgi:hypothetical protein